MSDDARPPLHPQVKVLFDMMAAGRAERVLEPQPMRDSMAALGALLTSGAPAVAGDREIRVPGPAGDVRARVFTPEGSGPPAGT